MNRVLPVVMELANRHPERTVFTRFIPPERPDQMPGMWQHYYTRWRVATRECLDLQLLELMPPLTALCPPAIVMDKTRYSALAEPRLIEHLRQREAEALIVSGSETDVCVLATVLDAVDLVAAGGQELIAPRLRTGCSVIPAIKGYGRRSTGRCPLLESAVWVKHFQAGLTDGAALGCRFRTSRTPPMTASTPCAS